MLVIHSFLERMRKTIWHWWWKSKASLQDLYWHDQAEERCSLMMIIILLSHPILEAKFECLATKIYSLWWTARTETSWISLINVLNGNQSRDCLQSKHSLTHSYPKLWMNLNVWKISHKMRKVAVMEVMHLVHHHNSNLTKAKAREDRVVISSHHQGTIR